MSSSVMDVEDVDEISQVDAQRLFETATKKWFGVSSLAFARAYDCGTIDRDTAKAQFVDSLRRLAR